MPLRHTLAAVFISVIWGFNFVVIKVGLDDFPPFLFSALRFAAAALPVLFLPAPPRHLWKHILAVGGVLGVVKFSFLFIGITAGMGAGLASLVLQTQVFITAILAFLLLNERLPRGRVAGMLICCVGLVVIGRDVDGSFTATGFALTLAAAAAWAVSNIVMKRMPPCNIMQFMVWVSVVPILPLLALSCLFEGPERMAAALLRISWLGVGAILYVSFIATVLGYAVWGWLLARYDASSVTPFSLLIPVVGIVSGWGVLGEAVSPSLAMGMALIMGGLGVNVFSQATARTGKIAVARHAAPPAK